LPLGAGLGEHRLELRAHGFAGEAEILGDNLDGLPLRDAAGPVAGSVGIEGGVVSGVINLESLGVRAPSRRPRHENRYHDA
jgi:hypothetical protein